MVEVRHWLVVICVAACGGSRLEPTAPTRPAASGPPAELAERPFVIPGEHMLLEMSWHGIPAARFEAAVGEPGAVDGRRAVVVWSEMKSDGLLAIVRMVHSEVTTAVDLDNGYPIRAVGSFEALFHGATHDTSADVTRVWGRDERVHNLHSMIIALRSWDPAPGTRAYLNGRFGRDTCRISVAAAGRELVKTKRFGKLPAVKVEGSGCGYRFAAWFSDDRLRRLVRIDVATDLGMVRADLLAWE